MNAEQAKSAHTITLTILLIVSGIFLYKIIAPFFSSICWALILGIFVAPLQRFLNHSIKSKSWAALAGVLITAGFIIAPIIIFGIQVSREANDFYHYVRDQHVMEQFQQWYQNEVYIRFSNWINNNMGDTANRIVGSLSNGVQQLLNNLSQIITTFISQSVLSIFNLFFVLFTLFFILRDGDKFHQWLLHLIPIGNERKAQLARRIKQTINATFYGTLLLSVQNGLLLGFMFYILQLPGALLWTLLMILLAVIPVIGPAIVWLPAVIWLFAVGQTLKGLILLIWCTIVISIVARYLQPLIMKKHTRLHPAAAFYGVLGGLFVFGLLGLVLGPVLIACFTTVAGFLIELNHKPPANSSPAD